jgi:RNA polymerase sigma-B factor
VAAVETADLTSPPTTRPARKRRRPQPTPRPRRKPEERSDQYGQYRPLFATLVHLPPNDPRRDRLRETLVTGHLPVAKHIARRFGGRGEREEDLVQVATVGLINAVDRYNPDFGKGFLPFAVPTIMGEVRRHFRDSGWTLRVPRRLKELHLSLTKATAELSRTLGRSPRPSEIAEHLGLTKDEVIEGLEVAAAYRPASLDTPLRTSEDAAPLGELLGDDDPAMSSVENYAMLAPALRSLPERERRIIVLRFFHNMTQTQIADEVGISQMHVSRLLGKTLGQLRQQLTQRRD